MIRLKYMLAPAIIFCCAPALQAATSPLDPIIVGQNHSPRKKNLGKSNIQRLNNEIEKALTTYNKQSSAINENRVDSIIYKADGNATKTIYTYDKEGNIVTETEYFKSSTSNAYIQSSSVYYGPGGDKCPTYTIVTQNDDNDALRTRYEYDWTQYAPIDDKVNPSPWDHSTLVQEEVNGQWKTLRACTPEFKDGRLMSLTYEKLNDVDVLEKAYHMVYQYDSEGKLVKINYKDYTKDESTTYDINYTDDGKLLRYGFENGTWYAQYEYNDDKSYTYTEHDCSNGNDIIDYSLKYDFVKDTPFDFEDNQEWSRITETNHDEQGNVTTSEVTMTSFNDKITYFVVYTLNSDDTLCDMMGATIKDDDDNIYVDYYKYDDKENQIEWGSYRQTTEYIDTYTKRNTFYDENGLAYSDQYTYYHNPDIAAVRTITDMPSDSTSQRIFDISGRITHQKSGLIIINGKKMFIRSQH